MRQMVEGVLDIAVMYRPQLRPGLSVEQILDGELVMVSAQPRIFSVPDETYIYTAMFRLPHGAPLGCDSGATP